MKCIMIVGLAVLGSSLVNAAPATEALSMT